MRISLFVPFLVAALIIVGYEAFVRVTAYPIVFSADYLENNRIRVQNYADSGHRAEVVLVGTSLTDVMRQSLPPGWVNLGLSSDSAMTGLEIVAHTTPLPKRLLIEANYFFYPVNSDVVDDASGDLHKPMRRYLWLTRAKYRPANIAAYLIFFRHARQGGGAFVRINFHQLEAQFMTWHVYPPPPTLRPAIAHAAELISQMRAKGVEVGFYDMPEERTISTSPIIVIARQDLRKKFPPSQYCWLILDHGEDWQTADGVHLLGPDAARVARRFSSAPCDKPFKEARAP